MSNAPVPAIIRFISLRPALSWSVASFLTCLILMPIVRWRPFDENDLTDPDSGLIMVEMTLPRFEEEVVIPEPEKAIEEAITEAIAEEIKFGDDSPDYEELTPSAIAPQLRFNRLPHYPDSMKSKGIEGVVVIELGIDETGRVLFGKIVESLGREFDLAVIEWAKELKFYPALNTSRVAFRCRVRLPVRFTLEK